MTHEDKLLLYILEIWLFETLLEKKKINCSSSDMFISTISLGFFSLFRQKCCQTVKLIYFIFFHTLHSTRPDLVMTTFNICCVWESNIKNMLNMWNPLWVHIIFPSAYIVPITSVCNCLAVWSSHLKCILQRLLHACIVAVHFLVKVGEKKETAGYVTFSLCCQKVWRVTDLLCLFSTPDHVCGFEDERICGFSQDRSDVFDWTRQNHLTQNPKRSANTGPETDRSGTKEGEETRVSVLWLAVMAVHWQKVIRKWKQNRNG